MDDAGEAGRHSAPANGRGAGGAGAGRRLLEWAGGLTLVALTLREAYALAFLVAWDISLPRYDEASHAWAGIEVAQALRALDPIAFLLALDRQVVWPFVHSLLLAPAYLAAGEDINVARYVSVGAWAAATLLLAAAGRAMHPARGAWIGLAAAALALLSPLHQAFGTLAMLEATGTALLALALVLHLMTLPGEGARVPVAASAVAALALFLCKTNYGLMWIAPLAIGEWRLAPPEQRARAHGAIAAWWKQGGAWRPLPLALAVGVVAMAAIAATGGGEARFLRRTITFRSPGNLATLLVWLAAIACAWRALADRPSTVRAWRALEPRQRALLAWLVLPILAWLLIPWPNRIRELVGFTLNRDSGLPFWTAAGFLDSFRSFVTQCSPTPAIGVAMLAAALWPPSRRASPRERLVWLAGVIAFAATIVHRDRAPRFLATVAPLLWLAAASRLLGAADALLDRTLTRPALACVARSLAGPLLAAALLALAAVRAPDLQRASDDRAAYVLHADVHAAMIRVLALAAEDSGPAWLLGLGNDVSPGLLRWESLWSHVTPGRFPKRPEWIFAGESPWRSRRGVRVLAALPVGALAAREPAWAAEVRADSTVAARLAADSTVTIEHDERLGDVRVLAFRVR